MDLRAQSALLAALFAVVLAIAVALRSTERRQAARFALLAGSLALWHLAEFLLAATGQSAFLRMSLVTATIIPAAAHRFYHAFLSVSAVRERDAGTQARARLQDRILWGAAALSAVLSLTPLGLNKYFQAIVAIWIFIALAAVLYRVGQHRDATLSRIERIRLTYVVVGGGIAMGFALAGLFPGLSGLFPAIGNVGLVVYLYFLSQAILRHRLLDLNELLGRIAVLSGLGIILTVIYGALIAAVGDNRPLLVFNVLLASFVMVTLFEPIRARLEATIMTRLFSERHQLTRTLARLRRELPGIIDVHTATDYVLEALYESNRVTHASFYLLAEDHTGYRLLSSRGPEPPYWLDAVRAREIVSAATGGQKAILRETVERRLHTLSAALLEPEEERVADPAEPELLESLRRIIDAMDQMKTGVTVPLVAAGRVVGLLNLRDERVYEAYSTDELAAVITVADRVATVVENSRLFEKMKERDRLAVLGEMSAGLAHEIRNPLGAIKAAAQYLDPNRLEGDDGEFLQIIIDEVDRLNGVVSQFLDYARPLKSNLVPTDVTELVDRTLRLLDRELPEGIETRVEHEDGPLVFDADPEQLRQVLLNLVLNAVQAMEDGGTLTIRTGAGDRDASGEGATVFIRVADTGPGIEEEIRRNLFVPFYTTKQGGTGLGLAICQRIVQNHEGHLDVHSRPGEGAEFVVRLPRRHPEALESPTDSEKLAEVLPLKPRSQSAG